MGIKISDLTSATSLTGSEEIPIVQSGNTKKATIDMVKPTIATSITSSSTNDEVAGARAVFDIINSPMNNLWEKEQPLEKEETKEAEKTTLQNEGGGDSK